MIMIFSITKRFMQSSIQPSYMKRSNQVISAILFSLSMVLSGCTALDGDETSSTMTSNSLTFE